MLGALNGITVLDITDNMSGAIATMLLCDNGARVIRAETDPHPNSRTAPKYAIWDRGKEKFHLGLNKNLKGDEHSQASVTRLFYQLVKSIDVLVTDSTTTLHSIIDISYQKLSAINPRLIYCSITSYGEKGPIRHNLSLDDLIMARTGILSSQPSFRPGPVHVIHPLPSIGASLWASIGISAALYAREKTGLGRKVETSLMAGTLMFSPKTLGEHLPDFFFPNSPAGGGPFYSLYECADGEWIHLGCIHGGFIDIAVSVMGIAHLITEPKFGEGRDPDSEDSRRELFEIVKNIIKTKSFNEWEALFEDADVPFAKACTTDESMDNPQVRFNDMVVKIKDPVLGDMLQMGNPIKFSESPGDIRNGRQVNDLHNKQTLEDLSKAISIKSIPTSKTGTIRGDLLPTPLEGVNVVELTNVISGPMAGKILADLGANCIKVEPPYGDISRAGGSEFFVHLNSNKRSICLNAKTNSGKDILQKLVSKADVVLDNMRPGTADRLGVGHESIAKLNPNTIETHITGYGPYGPYAQRPGVDPLAQALMGLHRSQGGTENPPVFLGKLAPTDFASGSLGALGTVMALFYRERTGTSQSVETNLLNAGILLSSESFSRYEGKPERILADRGQHGLSALHRLYQTNDGWIYMIASSKKELLALSEIIRLDKSSLSYKFTDYESLAGLGTNLTQKLSDIFRSYNSNGCLQLLHDAGVPCAPVITNYGIEFFSDPQAISNNMIIEHNHRNFGKLKFSQNLIVFGVTNEICAKPTPLLGEHSAEILKESGFSDITINRMFANKTIKTDYTY